MIDEELDKFHERAASAVNGYVVGDAINCHSYGRDVLKLVAEIRKLKGENERLVKVAYPDTPHGSTR